MLSRKYVDAKFKSEARIKKSYIFSRPGGICLQSLKSKEKIVF